MPKIPFRHENATGEVMEFVAECSVDGQGVFAIVIPDELADVVLTRTANIAITKPRKNWRVEHRDLDTAKRHVQKLMQEHLSVETTRERVIVYDIDLRVSYWECLDGSIHPNGSNAKDGQWSKVGNRLSFSQDTHGPFGIGLFAEVVDRVTHKRANSTKTEFEYADTGNHGPLKGMEWAFRLNHFIKCTTKKNYASLDSMPYTEEAARFFAESLTAICTMARTMDSFFSDPAKLQLAITNGALPLLAAPAKK
jgi:hypothetical protein